MTRRGVFRGFMLSRPDCPEQIEGAFVCLEAAETELRCTTAIVERHNVISVGGDAIFAIVIRANSGVHTSFREFAGSGSDPVAAGRRASLADNDG